MLRINLAYATCGSVSNSTAPPTCRAKTIRDRVDARICRSCVSSIERTIEIFSFFHFSPPRPSRTIANRFLIGTPRCVNSLLFLFFFSSSFLFAFLARSFGYLLTVLLRANRIRYRRSSFSPLTPGGQPNVIQGVRVEARQRVVLGNRYPAVMLLLKSIAIPTIVRNDGRVY